MMIEVVPFFLTLIQGITTHIGEDDPKAIVATTMVAFALSSVLTGAF
jgi:SulP family sulfate permease